MIKGQKHNQTIPVDPTLALMLDSVTEMICALDDDRMEVTRVIRMTNGRIGFTVLGGEGQPNRHFTLQLREGQD